MREYELVFIVHPDLDDNAFNEVITRVNGWITEGGGELLKTDVWGKRRLAYPIRKLNEGQYVFIQAKLVPSFGATLERNMRLLESVIRYSLIVKN